MLDQNDLQAIAQLIDAKLKAQQDEFIEVIHQQTETLLSMTDSKIRESETRTRVFIENSVTGKIEALFDGYKLTHEKQWELEHQAEALKQKVDALEARLEALESRIA